jgi:hypothetical protein
MGQQTLIPFPALETVNIVTVDDDGGDLVIKDTFHRTARLGAQRFFCIAEDEVDLASDSLSSLGVIAYTKESERAKTTIKTIVVPVTIMTLILARRRVPIAS